MKTLLLFFLLLAAYVVSGKDGLDYLIRSKSRYLSPLDVEVIRSNPCIQASLQVHIEYRRAIAEAIRTGYRYFLDANPKVKLEMARLSVEISYPDEPSRAERFILKYKLAKWVLATKLRDRPIKLDMNSHPFELSIDRSNYASESSIFNALQLFDKAINIAEQVIESEKLGTSLVVMITDGTDALKFTAEGTGDEILTQVEDYINAII
jgi:hypothetical protein